MKIWGRWLSKLGLKENPSMDIHSWIFIWIFYGYSFARKENPWKFYFKPREIFRFSLFLSHFCINRATNTRKVVAKHCAKQKWPGKEWNRVFAVTNFSQNNLISSMQCKVYGKRLSIMSREYPWISRENPWILENLFRKKNIHTTLIQIDLEYADNYHI